MFRDYLSFCARWNDPADMFYAIDNVEIVRKSAASIFFMQWRLS